MSKFSDVLLSKLSKLSTVVFKSLDIGIDDDRRVIVDTNRIRMYANKSKDDDTSNFLEVNMFDNGTAYSIKFKDKDGNSLSAIKATKDYLSINDNNLFENKKLNTETILGKQIFDIGNHTKIAKIDLETENGKGNMQGVCVVDGYIYAHKNIKDNANGIKSYSPDEKGKIYKFDLDGNLILKTDDLDKFAHQGFAHYKDGDTLKFICSGGTDDGEVESVYKSYIYEDKEDYLNAGKKISILTWDETETPSIDRYRVMDDYDENNEKDTKWLHSVPTVDNDGKNLIVVFTNPKNTREKLVRVYDSVQDIIDGDYNNPKIEFKVSRSYDIQGYYDFQGVAHRNGAIYMYFGSYDSTHIRNREIQIYDLGGNLIKNEKFHANFINIDDYSLIEPEGISFENENIYGGFHCKNNNGDYEDYVVQFSTKEKPSIIEESVPYVPYASCDVNMSTSKGTWFRAWEYDEDEDSFKNLMSVTDLGNPRYLGSYIGILYNPSNSEDFNKIVSYDTVDDILQIRAWSSLEEGGAGINLYKKGGSGANAGGLTFFRDEDGNYIFDDCPTADPQVENAIWNDSGTLMISAG